MTVDLMARAKMEDQIAIQEAAAAGLRGLEHLVLQLSHQRHQQTPLDCREITDHTISKFNKVISILNRTGHARFRRGPSSATQALTLASPPPPAPSLPPPSQTLTLDFTNPSAGSRGTDIATSHFTNESFSISTPMSSANSSFLSSITGDGSVSNGKQGSSLLLGSIPSLSAGGKPPLSSGYKKKCHAHSGDDFSGGRCHCSKRRKSRVKRTTRVPAISSKMADIPPDEFSWRKYGQKPIKGSPYPR